MGNEFIKIIKYLWSCVINLIYCDDRECIICNEYISKDKYLCSECRSKVHLCKNYFQIGEKNFQVMCYSAAYYSETIKDLVIKLKYKSDFKAGEALATYMVDTIKSNNIKFDVITYIPSTKESVKKRGYNQSEYLAKTIGSKIEVKVSELLVKSRSTRDQIGLNEEERWKNLKDSFKCTNEKLFIEKIILLVDDVVTTGATSFYCAKAILENGASDVIVLTCAKSRL